MQANFSEAIDATFEAYMSMYNDEELAWLATEVTLSEMLLDEDGPEPAEIAMPLAA